MGKNISHNYEKHVEKYLSIARVFFVVLDTKGNITLINEYGLETLGYQKEELIGENWFKTCLPVYFQKDVISVYNSLMKGEVDPVVYYENSVLKKDGTERIIAWHNTILEDSEGNITGSLSSGTDITDHKKSEATLRANEERLKAVMETIVDPLVVYDDQGKVTYLNPAFTRVFGWGSEELMGKRIDFVPDEEMSATQNAITRVFQGEGLSGFETARKTKGGSIISVRVGAALLLNSEGKPNGIVVNLQDISKEKQAQTVLNEMNQELENAIEKANIMAQNAEVANIAKSEFLANMSHEIRTPMNGVVGMTSLLLGTSLTDEQRDFTETIKNSGDALLDIINDILDYSKIESGKLELENIDFDLRITLDEISDLISIKANEKKLEFNNMFHHEVPSLLCGDPGRLRQILINLSGNSIKFTDRGEVIIHTTLDHEDPTHVTVRFSVIDTGIGIPKNRMDRLFKSFSQVDSSTTRKYGGTGLGLTISKKLVEKMGGEIGVNSKEGKGSTFWFTAVLKKQPESRKKKEIIPEDISNKRILIVDDNATNRYILQEQLKLWECRYKNVADGENALKELRRGIIDKDPFEIAILDMQMPVMDGKTLGKKIKQDPDIKDTILILMSSMGHRGDAKQLKKIGFAAYLIKPVKQIQLFECLSTVAGIYKKSKIKDPEMIVTKHSLAEDQKQKINILLAEDNKINQKVALSILKKLGYNADTAVNGKETIKALENINYDIVLMDCQMPEMDGYETTSVIRNSNSKVLNHDTTIIAMTANAMKGDQEKCIAAGMDDYLSKPVKPQGLSDMLDKWTAKNMDNKHQE